MADAPDLDPIVHAPIRLAALSLLAGVDEAEFTVLRDRTATTDGNLSVHLAKLEQAKYIAVDKRFVERRPRTYYRLTAVGRRALLAYVSDLRRLLGPGMIDRDR